MSLRSIVLPFVIITVLVSIPAAEAQTLVGARLGAYVDQEDLFIGGEVLAPLGDHLFLNPNVEYVFVDRAKQATFNFDLHYDFARRGQATFWLGGGLGILYFDPDGPLGSNTDLGANLLFGVGFLEGRDVVPYVQAKVIVADDSELALGFGVRF